MTYYLPLASLALAKGSYVCHTHTTYPINGGNMDDYVRATCYIAGYEMILTDECYDECIGGGWKFFDEDDANLCASDCHWDSLEEIADTMDLSGYDLTTGYYIAPTA